MGNNAVLYVFPLQVMVFALLVTALNGSSDSGTKRGIYTDLDATFDFPALQELGSRKDFRDTMLHIAGESKVLGSQLEW
jgi:hypothetical protein